MPRENKTKYAVLGLLAYAPLSGYDIRRIYERSLGNFWSESYGHIYPILKRLEDEGLATGAVQRQSGRPDRTVYTITNLGREELHRWLAQPLDPHKERVELLLKVFHGWEVGPDAMVELVRQKRAEHEALLRRYDQYDQDMTARPEPPTPYWLMTVSCGRHMSEAWLAWCDETLEKLEALPKEPRAGADRWRPVPHDHPEDHR